ncbi:hypothetical protein RUMHYD_01684 [Blautia hydrogenotrophica DSM 10507]|uniref:Uncharacterized protein n=1 Tax=Blautia hydrogenotrophica (strain DSM 10507 / JCM 14656 / S5a33) TaxID=476272 RepID=C0CLG2_BLAHS|nr:hypothetical protein RUMHYD_01684 [Blautia hydrogenotrophica DSM 10507]
MSCCDGNANIVGRVYVLFFFDRMRYLIYKMYTFLWKDTKAKEDIYNKYTKRIF